MCTGEERRAMLREAYRLGFASGRAEALAEVAGATQTYENVVDFAEYRDGRRMPKFEKPG